MFSDDAINIELGEPIDPQDGEVQTSFDLGKAKDFLSASGSKLTSIENITSVPTGSYTIVVELSSEFEGQVLSQKYEFTIIV